MKICKKCGSEYPATSEYFYKVRTSKSGKDVLRCICKSCESMRVKAYRDANKGKVLEKQKEYRESNKDKSKEYHKLYYQSNKEKLSEANARYQKDNPDRSRFYQLKYKYKVSEDSLMDMMNIQKGACAICGCDLVTPDSKRSYSVDHNHLTGNIRGLLCNSCNVLVGHANDDVSILSSAISYLKGEL